MSAQIFEKFGIRKVTSTEVTFNEQKYIQI